MTPRIARLYHLAEASNLPSILEHGLMSTERLLELARIPEADRNGRLRAHRPGNVRLSETVLIRDQKPMPPSTLERALEGRLAPADWYALFNSFVFFWLDPRRMERQRRACLGRPGPLSFDAGSLLNQFGGEALVSPINSGNARETGPARAWHIAVICDLVREGVADGPAQPAPG